MGIRAESLEKVRLGASFCGPFLGKGFAAYPQQGEDRFFDHLVPAFIIFISIVGVFGLVVFESEYKRKEIAVRKVLGSMTGEILYMFNVSYFWILLICFVFGAPVAAIAGTPLAGRFANVRRCIGGCCAGFPGRERDHL